MTGSEFVVRLGCGVCPSCNPEMLSLLIVPFLSMLDALDKPGMLLTSTDFCLIAKRFDLESSAIFLNEALSGPIPVLNYKTIFYYIHQRIRIILHS